MERQSNRVLAKTRTLPSAPGGRAPHTRLQSVLSAGRRANGRCPNWPGTPAPAALTRLSGSSGGTGLGGAARAKPELSMPPGSGDLPWSRIWRRAEGVRLPGCFGENNLRLGRSSHAAIQKQKDFFSSFLLRMAAIRFCCGRSPLLGPDRGELILAWEVQFAQLTSPSVSARGACAGLWRGPTADRAAKWWHHSATQTLDFVH